MSQGYEFDIANLPEDEWLRVTDGHRLPDKPTRQKLNRMMTWGAPVGVTIRGNPGARIVKLPYFLHAGVRYTTRDAYLWFIKQQNPEGT